MEKVDKIIKIVQKQQITHPDSLLDILRRTLGTPISASNKFNSEGDFRTPVLRLLEGPGPFWAMAVKLIILRSD
jgi:hypothetical protein